jgi:acyl carrier protein
MTHEEAETRTKETIVSALDLEDLAPGDIETDAPLFGEGLGLDSIDALELGMAVKKAFGVTFSSDPAENKRIFHSVKTLADFVLGAAPTTGKANGEAND